MDIVNRSGEGKMFPCKCFWGVLQIESQTVLLWSAVQTEPSMASNEPTLLGGFQTGVQFQWLSSWGHAELWETELSSPGSGRWVLLDIQGTAQGRLGSQWGLWAFWVLSTQWHCTGQGSPGSESSDGLPGEIEYDFCVRQMNLCWFMWADNLPLPKIWRNLWCWNQPLNNL